MKLLFLLLSSVCVFSIKIEQQHAVLKYANPKYINNFKILTGRTRRNGPYRTNSTMTTLAAFGNNVTMTISYKVSGVDFTWKMKCCEIVQHKWFSDYVRSISNLFDLGSCPFAPATYSIYNMEFPPKNSPLPMPKGDTALTYKTMVTETGELIFEVKLDLIVK